MEYLKFIEKMIESENKIIQLNENEYQTTDGKIFTSDKLVVDIGGNFINEAYKQAIEHERRIINGKK